MMAAKTDRIDYMFLGSSLPNTISGPDVASYGLFPPMETETEMDSHTDYCTKQVFPLVQRRIPIPLLKYSKIGMEIRP